MVHASLDDVDATLESVEWSCAWPVRLYQVESLYRQYPDLFRNLIVGLAREVFEILDSYDLLYIRSSLGLDGKPLYIVKLRYLTHTAESRVNDSAHAGCDLDEEGSFVHASGDYMTVMGIPYGKLVRSLKLDEIPGIVHWLLGDIALIGPRPWLVEELEAYPDYWRRLQELGCRPWLLPPTALWLVPDFPLIDDTKQRLIDQNLYFAEYCADHTVSSLLHQRLFRVLNSFSYHFAQMSLA